MILAALLAACLQANNLPLRTFDVPQPHGTVAILLTGDGGWKRIDEQIARRVREANIPVIGFLTPNYFSKRKTQQESACALEQVIRESTAKWNANRVILIGFSRGADILPFMISGLSPDVRKAIVLVALLGLEPSIDFHYHPTWIPFFHWHEQEFAVQPETEKMRDLRVLCIHGEREKDSVCPAIASWATSVREKGGHHFAGNYRAIAETILDAANR